MKKFTKTHGATRIFLVNQGGGKGYIAQRVDVVILRRWKKAPKAKHALPRKA